MISALKSAAKTTVRGGVHAALRNREMGLLAKYAEAAAPPPVFLIGAPRSGTSLAYELFVTRYHCAYFSNLAHRFYKTPVAASALGGRLITNHQAAYESDYGHIAGWGAPNEAGWIWQRWLADGDWCDESLISEINVAEMRATVAALQAVMSAPNEPLPFVNKNVMHANRMRLLDAIYPGCLFVEVRRDDAATARSIIRARRRGKGPEPHPDAWWSVRPSNARSGDVVSQAAWQVRGVAEDIARDGEYLGQGRVHTLAYSALCETPEPVLDAMADFLRQGGVELKTRGDLPAGFTLSPSRPLEAEEEARLQRELTHG